MERLPARILSGGQSGVDRAALDVAIAFGVDYGGWCPLGGWAEDLPHPPGVLAAYPELVPTPSADPAQRTRWNVRDSDAVLILTPGQIVSAGTALALASAMELGRPLAVLDPATPGDGLGDARELLAELDANGRLNVAGPRESEAPGIYAQSVAVLSALLDEL